MKKVFYPLMLLSFILVSCEPSLFGNILFRTIEDPFDDCPVADSISVKKTVLLSWKEDEGCDEFLLYRAEDHDNLKFELVYNGNNTSFDDKDVEENCNYIYRLDKKRGNAIFIGKKYAYGYGASCIKDSYEPNDNKENAVFLDYDLICNTTAVKYITNKKTYLDEDWFYVTIPPHRIAELLITQENINKADTDTDLKIQQLGKKAETVRQMSAISIENPTDERKDFYFYIFPNETKLFSGWSGNTIIQYKVSYSRMIDY